MDNYMIGLIITLFFAIGGFVLIFSTYIFGVRKNKNSNNFIMFNTLLITYDWIFYILFNIWIATHSDTVDDFALFSVYSLLSVAISMILFNLLLAVIILRREFKNNEQFRAWYQKHKVFCMFVVFCSPGGLNVLHVLNCKFNDMDIFDAKLSSTFEKKVIHASVISLLIGDLPRSCFSTFTNVVFQPYGFAYYAIPSISCLLTLSVFASGLFYRIYESTIRDYEKPTVQELIISKNQILEA